MNERLGRSFFILNLEKRIINKLLLAKISNVIELCNYSRMELNALGFANDDINEIIIKLQLNGLDLKPNHAKRNTLLDNYEG